MTPQIRIIRHNLRMTHAPLELPRATLSRTTAPTHYNNRSTHGSTWYVHCSCKITSVVLTSHTSGARVARAHADAGRTRASAEQQTDRASADNASSASQTGATTRRWITANHWAYRRWGRARRPDFGRRFRMQRCVRKYI